MRKNRVSLLPERLQARILVTDSGCWLFQCALDRKGYAKTRWAGKKQPAHRVVWQLLGIIVVMALRTLVINYARKKVAHA